jgi:D-alanyl-D-alanine-carboxypeptidase/D-alanyl-D-alanine-endopeptidase
LLGLIVTRKSGRRYQDYITGSILRPLGMSATRWDNTDATAGRTAVGYSWIDGHWDAQPRAADGAFSAAAGLVTTAADYSRFIAWVLSTWDSKADVKGILDPASLREAGRGAVLSQVGGRSRSGAGKEDCPVAWQYGYGFYIVTDCELGTMLRHPGGLPGFGSQLLLLPRAGIGIFAFANLTYARLTAPVIEAAVKLQHEGLAPPQLQSLSAALRRAAQAIGEMYRATDVAIDPAVLAENFLQDSPAARRNDELRTDKAALGSCGPAMPEEIRHALAARFTLLCEHGRLIATVLLAPTPQPRIQYLGFERSQPAGQP